MRLLIVEDKEDTIDIFKQELNDLDINFNIAISRDSAFDLIQSKEFDLVVLDLKIPPSDRGLDSDVKHGLAVHSKLQELNHATPIIFHSGYGTIQLVGDLLKQNWQEDIFGLGNNYPMLSFIAKDRLADCIQKVKDFVQTLRLLDQIEISFGAQKVDLTHDEKQILRIFANTYDGKVINVLNLSGGLSSTKTLSVEVHNKDGTLVSNAVSKLGDNKIINNESILYQKYVAPSFEVGCLAHVMLHVKAGAGRKGGIFYGLAKRYDSTLFDFVANNPSETDRIVERIMEIQSNWHDGAPVCEKKIQEIRASLISDDEFKNHVPLIKSFSCEKVEQNNVSVKWCLQHRDLHGLNVLIKQDYEPLIIDYGSVERASACLDMLTLELSVLFHPAARELRKDWPSEDDAKNWSNLDEYVKNCPFANFVRNCREAAFACHKGAGDKGVYANAYAYSISQLKYDDTDKKLVLAVAASAAGKILAS